MRAALVVCLSVSSVTTLGCRRPDGAVVVDVPAAATSNPRLAAPAGNSRAQLTIPAPLNATLDVDFDEGPGQLTPTVSFGSVPLSERVGTSADTLSESAQESHIQPGTRRVEATRLGSLSAVSVRGQDVEHLCEAHVVEAEDAHRQQALSLRWCTANAQQNQAFMLALASFGLEGSAERPPPEGMKLIGVGPYVFALPSHFRLRFAGAHTQSEQWTIRMFGQDCASWADSAGAFTQSQWTVKKSVETRRGFKLLVMTADASSSANASKPIIRSACVDREPKTSLQIEVWSDGAGKSSIRFDDVVDAALGLALAP